jgi:hypothetical protein
MSALNLVKAFVDELGLKGKSRKSLNRIMDNLADSLKRDVQIDVRTAGGAATIAAPSPPAASAAAPSPAALAPGPENPFIDLGFMGGIGDLGPLFGIPALARGGIVDRPTFALIGEAGPEAVVPLSGRNGMGNTYNVTVNAGIGTDGAEVGRQVVEAIKAYERRNGPVYASA